MSTAWIVGGLVLFLAWGHKALIGVSPLGM